MNRGDIQLAKRHPIAAVDRFTFICFFHFSITQPSSSTGDARAIDQSLAEQIKTNEKK